MSQYGQFECRHCGEVKEHCCHISETMNLCCKCGEEIANQWWKKHSGVWLTYSEQARPEPGFRKRSIPEELRWQVFERDGFRCRHCPSQTMLRADHIIPESKGGELSLDNLQTLCHRCNSKKGSK